MITIDVKVSRNLARFPSEMQSSIADIRREVVRKGSFEIFDQMRKRAPRGVRSGSESLRGSIQRTTNLSGRDAKASVFISSANRNDEIALINEFGVRRAYTRDLSNPKWVKLREWADIKTGMRASKGNKIRIGGPRTALGRKNVFIRPSIAAAEAKFPRMISSIVSKRFKEAEGRLRA